MVRKLGLIGPAGLPMKEHWVMKLCKVPPIGEWLMNLFGDIVILSGLKQDFYSLEGFSFSEYTAKYRAQMKYVGFKRALLSTIRSGLVTGMKQTYARVGAQRRSMILIWGEEDHMVPFKLSEQVRELIPNIEFYPIHKAGHAVHYERSDVVNPLLLKFLTE